MGDPGTDLARYVLEHHRDQWTPEESRARTLSILAAKASRSASRRVLEQPLAAASESAPALLGTAAIDEAIVTRILTERAVEIWPNRCPQCGAVCRTPLARQCPACDFSWYATPKYRWYIRRASPRWDRCADRAVCHQVPGVGLVVCVADGAGNSIAGVSAAESVIRKVRAHTWTSEGDAWDLQELLMAVDAELYGTGGETTAAVAVFGAGGHLRAAVAGDTKIFARTGSETWTLPLTRTGRLGSGSAVPATYSGVVAFPVYVATDGAWTSGFEGLERSLRAHPSNALPWIEQQCRLSGDDATLIEITAS